MTFKNGNMILKTSFVMTWYDRANIIQYNVSISNYWVVSSSCSVDLCGSVVLCSFAQNV